jgi:predicted DNA-binding protein with PD1-like motif
LVGTLAGSGHLHTVLGRQDGSTLSGHVVGNMIIHTTAEIVIGNCENVKYERIFDQSTGFTELSISKKKQ